MYYPESQIITNLYTAGGEYEILSSRQEYIGYYWKSATGKYFTGNTPQSPNSLELLPANLINDIFDNPTSQVYLTFYPDDDVDPGYIDYSTSPPNFYLISQGISLQNRQLWPSYFLNIPTNKDYQIGEYKRYFCKKSNELIYLEISKDYYNKLLVNDQTVAFQYFIPFNITWKLLGDKEQMYKTNKNIVELIIKQQKLFKFDQYLKKDYTKYYKNTA